MAPLLDAKCIIRNKGKFQNAAMAESAKHPGLILEDSILARIIIPLRENFLLRGGIDIVSFDSTLLDKRDQRDPKLRRFIRLVSNAEEFRFHHFNSQTQLHFPASVNSKACVTVERLIDLTKTSLRKMVGKKKLRFIQLHTIITQIEAVSNNHPLTRVPRNI